ncbi:cobalamin-dependent protein [Candidatus Borrarchaeum sp.]|uniref:cobalamin-dependent protein n=1 Tax=Candidatus Borrarchaeum sp. TaxID=2846742 RepID=UPI00257F26D5|nr:cobalamin-dependent protein [Candidatus Borrarchaeum sp.]
MDVSILKIKEDLLEKVKLAVIDGNDIIIGKYILNVLNSNIPNPFDSIMTVLIEGIKRVADMYETGECELPDLILAGESLKEALSIITNNVRDPSSFLQIKKGKVILGTVEGDTHDIGKNVVAAMLQANGFEVIDLGQNVPPQIFVEKAVEEKANIIGASSFMSSTRNSQKKILEELEKVGLRDKIIFLIGGAAVSKDYAKTIGADGYAKDAFETVELLEGLVNNQKKITPEKNHKLLLKMEENRKMIEQLADQVKQFQDIIGKTTSREVNVDKSRLLISQKFINVKNITFSEEKVYKILSSLSNKVRLRVLMALWQKPLHFSEIEEVISVKGGHLQFHVGKLKNEGLIEQKKNRGKYSVTQKGKKVIMITSQLSSLEN